MFLCLESLIHETFIKCLLRARMLSVASVSVFGGKRFIGGSGTDTQINELFRRHEKMMPKSGGKSYFFFLGELRTVFHRK